MRPARIEVEIEELVLRGLPARDGHRIGDAVRGALEHLLAEGEPPAVLRADAAIPSLEVGAVELQQNTKPETIGLQVAVALYGGLTR